MQCTAGVPGAACQRQTDDATRTIIASIADVVYVKWAILRRSECALQGYVFAGKSGKLEMLRLRDQGGGDAVAVRAFTAPVSPERCNCVAVGWNLRDLHHSSVTFQLVSKC